MVGHYDTVQWSPYFTNSKILVEVACPVGRSSGRPKLTDQRARLLMPSHPTSVHYRERGRALHHHLHLCLWNRSMLFLFILKWGVKIGRGRSQRSTGTHLQEVILNVAVEGATQPHRVVLPQLVGLKVQTKLLPAVLQAQTERRLHLEEHGWQLLDVEDVCGDVGGWNLGFQVVVGKS